MYKNKLTGISVFLAASIGLFVSQSALAAGTASGLDIDNTASMDYKVGTVGQDAIASNLSTFKVDNKVDLIVTANGDVSVIPNSNDQVLIFSVTNTGNTTQGYLLDALNGAGDTIDMNNVEIWLDGGALDGSYNSADDTLYSTGSNAGDLAPDAAMVVFIVSDTPSTAVDSDSASYNLLATTLNAGSVIIALEDVDGNDSTLVEVVFADGSGSSAEAGNDGSYSTNAIYNVDSASIVFTKSSAVTNDPINGATSPYAIPGATVEYTLDVTNNGSVSANTVVVTDPIPSNTAFAVGSVTSTGTTEYSSDGKATWTYVPVADGNGTDVAVTHVKTTFASIASASSEQLIFSVKIN